MEYEEEIREEIRKIAHIALSYGVSENHLLDMMEEEIFEVYDSLEDWRRAINVTT